MKSKKLFVAILWLIASAVFLILSLAHNNQHLPWTSPATIYMVCCFLCTAGFGKTMISPGDNSF